MKNTVKLTDTELGIIDVVVSRFLSERKPTPRRHLVVRFREPGVLETLLNRSLLRERDPNRQEFLPTLLSFEFCSNKAHLALAKQSVATVLHALTALFLKNEDDQMYTVDQIEAQARELGRVVGPDTIWLGLYFTEDFGVLGGWVPGDDPARKTAVRVSEWILRQKDIDNAWDNLVKLRTQWQLQRESYNPATGLQELQEALKEPNQSPTDMKETIQIFISHSSKDHDIALSFIELLRAALPLKDQDIRCTSITGFRLPAGANTDEVLKAEVLQAKTFIGLISPNSISSAYVLFELGARWGAKKYMIPLLAGLGPEALQGPLKGINAISADQIGQLHQLLSDLADELELPLQRAAAYTRYAERLSQKIEQFYQRAAHSTSTVPATANNASLNDQHASFALSRAAVIIAAQDLEWDKELPKWTVTVEGRRLPIRPLARAALGLPPHGRVSTRRTVETLKKLGFPVLYEGKPV